LMKSTRMSVLLALFCLGFLQANGQATVNFVGAGYTNDRSGNHFPLGYSTDGASWTKVQGNNGAAISFNQGNAVAYGAGTWVAVGHAEAGGHNVVYSSDGISWTGITVNDLGTGFAIAYSSSQSLWVCGGFNSQSYNTLFYSSNNGVTWTGAGNKLGSGANGIAYSPSLNIWVAVSAGGGSNSIVNSANGVSWSYSTGISNTVYGFRAVAWSSSQNLFVAVGNSVFANSASGTTWTATQQTSTIFNGQGAYGVAFAQGKWLAPGYCAYTPCNNGMAISTDGSTWTGDGVADPHLQKVNDAIAYSTSQTLWVRGGAWYIVTSSDGVTWSSNVAALDQTHGLAVAA